MEKRTGYIYTKLDQIKKTGVYNLYGLVDDFVHVPKLTRTGRTHMICRLKDETLLGSFRVQFFIPAEENISGLQKDCIVRLHRVKVEEFNGELDGRVFFGKDVVVFKSELGSDYTFTTSALNPSMSEDDKKRVEELRELLHVRTLIPEDEGVTLTVTDSQRITIDVGCNTDSEEENDISAHSVFLNPEFAGKEILLNPFNNIAKKLYVSKAPVDIVNEEEGLGSVQGNNVSANETKTTLAKAAQSPACEGVGRKEGLLKRKFICSEESSRMNCHRAAVDDPIPEKTGRSVNNCISADNFTEEITASASHPVPELNGGNDLKQGKDSSDASPICPGLICSREACVSEPIILDDDDPRLAGFNENDLIFEGLGDIPAVDENGEVIISEYKFLPYEGSSNPIRTTCKELKNFRWPCYNVKVKIVKMKPSISTLQESNPKDLLSGKCKRCGSFAVYSRLQWKRDEGIKMKKPLCPYCHEDGRETFVSLRFRIKFSVQDSWGTELDLYAVGKHASKFIGVSPKDYVSNAECRRRSIQLLSAALSSSHKLSINVCLKQTLIKPIVFIYNTELSRLLD